MMHRCNVLARPKIYMIYLWAKRSLTFGQIICQNPTSFILHDNRPHIKSVWIKGRSSRCPKIVDVCCDAKISLDRNTTGLQRTKFCGKSLRSKHQLILLLLLHLNESAMWWFHARGIGRCWPWLQSGLGTRRSKRSGCGEFLFGDLFVSGTLTWNCEQPNKIPANFKRWLSEFFDVSRVPNVWGTFFGVSGIYGYTDWGIQVVFQISGWRFWEICLVFSVFMWIFGVVQVIHRDVSQPFQDAGSSPTGLSHPKLFTIDLHATSRTLFVYCDAFARATACG